MTRLVLIIGSAPDAVRAQELDCAGVSAVVAINNAWRIRDDWTHLVHPEDFGAGRRPSETAGRAIITHEQFVPANNAFGGIVYAGGTMAFTTGYWALDALKPDVLAFIGCDMIYEGNPQQSHFYGEGEADPLRDDPTLQNLEAKAQRMRWLAARAGCWCVNLSARPRSRLTFDRLDPQMLAQARSQELKESCATGLAALNVANNLAAAETALETERQAQCVVETGDYWNSPVPLDARVLGDIDRLWMKVFTPTEAT